MRYVDGFVAAVVFKDHGANRITECWGDEVPDGEVTSFPMAVKKQEHETVVFSWVEWPSKDVREAGMQKIFEDPRMQDESNPMPFDGKRLIYGGFHLLMDN